MTNHVKFNRRAWPQEWRDEYDQMLNEIIEATTDTHFRLDLFENRLNDAIQAQRSWARDIERKCLRSGLASEVKAYQDRNRVMVGYEGTVISLPRPQGMKTRSATGQLHHQRELIELRPWDEIIEKRRDTLRTRRVYDARIAHYDKLLALRDMCPDAATPAEAADRLNVDLDSYLAGAA